jgi:hypothetical protein
MHLAINEFSASGLRWVDAMFFPEFEFLGSLLLESVATERPISIVKCRCAQDPGGVTHLRRRAYGTARGRHPADDPSQLAHHCRRNPY